MPASAKPKRVSLSVSLPPEQHARVLREAEARLVSPAYLAEKAFSLLFTSFDRPALGDDEA